jgi:hypothetical protein
LKDIALKQAKASDKKYYQARHGKAKDSEDDDDKEESKKEKKAADKPAEVEDLLGFGSSDPAPVQ